MIKFESGFMKYSAAMWRASHGDYGESRWQLQGNVLSQSHLLCDLPRDSEPSCFAASIWPHSLQLRRVDKTANHHHTTILPHERKKLFLPRQTGISQVAESTLRLQLEGARAHTREGERACIREQARTRGQNSSNWIGPSFLLGFLACFLSFFGSSLSLPLWTALF